MISITKTIKRIFRTASKKPQHVLSRQSVTQGGPFPRFTMHNTFLHYSLPIMTSAVPKMLNADLPDFDDVTDGVHSLVAMPIH